MIYVQRVRDVFPKEFKLRTTLVPIALAAAALATPVLAQSAVTVDYSDLDLQSDSGSQAMLARLRAAARRVCGPAPFVRALGAYEDYQACVKQSLGDAVATLGAPRVSAAHAGASGTGRAVASAAALR